VQHVSSVDLAYDQSSVAEPANRTIASAGILANLLFGIIALALLARLRTAGANTRYFLWLFGHSNLFVGSGYLLALSFAGFGDIQALVEGLTRGPILQVTFTLVGVAIALATYFHAARTLDEFLGRENRQQRTFALAVVPYFIIGLVNTAAGALNPESPTLILLSAAAASFGGNMPMAWLPFATRRIRDATPERPLTPRSDGFWITSAIASVVLLFVVLAPGAPRHFSRSSSPTEIVPPTTISARRPPR
jgi:hypothetical protein